MDLKTEAPQARAPEEIQRIDVSNGTKLRLRSKPHDILGTIGGPVVGFAWKRPGFTRTSFRLDRGGARNPHLTVREG